MPYLNLADSKCTIQRRLIFSKIRDFISSKVTDNNSSKIEVLSAKDLKDGDEINKKKLSEAFDKLVDANLPKGSGVFGFLFSKFIKYIGKKMVVRAHEQAGNMEAITREALAMIESDKRVCQILGSEVHFESVIAFEETVVNSEVRVQMELSVAGTRGRGSVSIKAENKVCVHTAK